MKFGIAHFYDEHKEFFNKNIKKMREDVDARAATLKELSNQDFGALGAFAHADKILKLHEDQMLVSAIESIIERDEKEKQYYLKKYAYAELYDKIITNDGHGSLVFAGYGKLISIEYNATNTQDSVVIYENEIGEQVKTTISNVSPYHKDFEERRVSHIVTLFDPNQWRKVLKSKGYASLSKMVEKMELKPVSA